MVPYPYYEPVYTYDMLTYEYNTIIYTYGNALV